MKNSTFIHISSGTSFLGGAILTEPNLIVAGVVGALFGFGLEELEGIKSAIQDPEMKSDE